MPETTQRSLPDKAGIVGGWETVAASVVVVASLCAVGAAAIWGLVF